MDKNLLSGQIESLTTKVNEAKLPQELKEKALTMINLSNISINSGESESIIRLESLNNYIGWITKIPFSKNLPISNDIEKAKTILDNSHYGLTGVKNRIIEYLSSIILSNQKGRIDYLHAPIICLVGLVGTGKTSLSYSIAEALSLPFQRIPFGGLSDVRTLRGSSRIAHDAEPGIVVKKLAQAQASNCVILLDELDRVADVTRSDIMGVLIELLDPEQNSSFLDHYIDYPIDLSKVIFIATANNTTNISTAVLDRLEIIQMPSYSDEEKRVIGEKYLLPKVSVENGLEASQIKISNELWGTIIRPLGFDSGIRSLERTLSQIARKTALKIVEGKTGKGDQVIINSDNLREFLENYG